VEGINFPDAMVIPWLHLGVFAAALAMMCLVRHAVYAAILSIALICLFVGSIWVTLLAAAKFGWMQSPPDTVEQLSEFHVATSLVACFFASTVIAWLAVRYDWGRKSRY
jgi:hypothetical protein